MNIVDSSTDMSIDEILINIENYRTTIQAIQIFIGFITWDNQNKEKLPDTNESIGRRMDTSSKNRINQLITITPDIAIQRNSELGYVVEAKKSLPRNTKYWRRIVEQLEKYDDDLYGWWTEDECIKNSCIVLLIEISRSADFKNYLLNLIQSENLKFVKPLSIVEFTRSPNFKQYIFIRKLWGEIEDQDLSEILESGKKIPIEEVLASFGEKKFYDSQPITEYIMEILWQVIFTERKSETEYDNEFKAWVFEINLDELTNDLQNLYGSEGNNPREVCYPRIGWVREAMEGFVNLGLAQKTSGKGNYIVLFKRLTGNVIEMLSKHRQNSIMQKQDDTRQLSLFDNKNKESIYNE